MKMRKYVVTFPVLAMIFGVLHAGCAMESGAPNEENNPVAGESAAEGDAVEETTEAVESSSDTQSLAAGGKWTYLTSESCMGACDSYSCSCLGAIFCPSKPKGKACPVKGKECYQPVAPASAKIYICR